MRLQGASFWNYLAVVAGAQAVISTAGSTADIQGQSNEMSPIGVESLSMSPQSMKGLDDLSSYLTQLLKEPWNDNDNPLVYVESPSEIESGEDDDLTVRTSPWKRSRYNRRYYNWKRQNRSRNYDTYQYMCTPSRREVFQLLVALHEARSGNLGRTINFCNRKRPAGAILTNIRFLGRRK